MMSGRCFSASLSHVVTCARMSFTDQSPVTPGSVSRGSDKPAEDSLRAAHAVSSLLRRRCLSVPSAMMVVCMWPCHLHPSPETPMRASCEIGGRLRSHSIVGGYTGCTLSTVYAMVTDCDPP